MTSLRIIFDNASDAATLSVSPAVVATLPVTNLQLLSRAKVVRTTSTAAQQIKGTWSAAVLISACALWRHNLTSSATWRLELFSDAAWTTSVYDSGAVVACPPKALNELLWGVEPLGASVFYGWDWSYSSMWFTGTAARSFRITLTDAANPAGYMQAGRLFLGNALEPFYNMDYGVRVGWKDDSKQERTEGGSLRSDNAEPYRVMRIPLDHLTDADRAKFLEMMRIAGRRNEVFVSAYPGAGGAQERDHAIAAKFTGFGDITHPQYSFYSQELELEET